MHLSLLLLLLSLVLSSCSSHNALPVSAGFGPDPVLPPPRDSWLPVTKIAPAVGWPVNAKPHPASGLRVTRFGDALAHPRWLYVLPNGDVLVAETDAPPRPEDNSGPKGWLMSLGMKAAGSHLPSADRISILRDADGDGRAEIRTTFLSNLSSPFGMALVDDRLYVANTDAIVSFPYRTGDLSISAPPTKLIDLPAGPINHHWTKNIIASPDGDKLYVTIGSNSNAAENGIDKERDRAQIWEVDRHSGGHRVFASGLRNPNGMAWQPESGALWTAVNERDELGNDLVPDYMTALHDGGFYGWPYSYFGSHLDPRVAPQRPDLVAKAIVPDYALGAHTAALGLAYSDDNALPKRFHHGMFVGLHGSWNRDPRNGYQVIFVPFQGSQPSGAPVTVLNGFIDNEGNANGRPVGLAFDKRGGLLIADDVGSSVWRVDGEGGKNGGRHH